MVATFVDEHQKCKTLQIQVDLLQHFQAHQDAIYAISPGFESNEYITGAGDKRVILWNKHDNQKARVLASGSAPIYFLQTLPDHHLLLGDNAGNLFKANLAGKTIEGELSLGDTIFCGCLIDNRLVLGLGNGSLAMVHLPSFTIKLRKKPCENHIRSMVQLNDRLLATGDSNGIISIISTEDFTVLDKWQAHDDSVFSLLPWKNQHLLSGGKDARLKLWESNGIEHEEMHNVPAHLFTINDMVTLQDGKHIATASRDKTIKIWEADTLLLRKVISREKFSGGHTHSVNRLLFDPEQNQLFSAGDDRVVRQWEISIE